MKKKITVLTLSAMLYALSFSVHAQQAGKDAKGFPGAWFGRCIDMANYWLEQESLYEQSERESHKAA